MAEKTTIPDFPTLPDFGQMITQACEVVASVRGIPYDFNGTLSLENKFVVLFKTVKEMFDAQDALVKSYKALHDFVNQFFTNLNLQDEVNKKIEEMKTRGELLHLLTPTVSNEITRWLVANITNPSTPPLDKSLTVENAAADSKATGIKIKSVSEELNHNIYSMVLDIDQGYYAIVDGLKVDSQTWCRTKNFVNRRYIVESSYRMYVCAFKNDLYIGTWNGRDFIKIFDNTLHIHSVDFNELSQKYKEYQFVIDFYNTGTPLSAETVYSDLKITDVLENEHEKILEFDKKMKNISSNVIFINHRGFNTVAPENTIPAFELSAKEGFVYVETDVLFTFDNIPVLLHDGTINRTARNYDGTTLTSDIAIRNITYQQALTYDFGIWKGEKYKGTKIPTFDEFMSFCKSHSLKPFIELKDEIVYTESMVRSIINIVKKYGMIDNVWFISFSYDNLLMVKNILPSAKLGIGAGYTATRDESSFMSVINQIKNLRTDTNTVAMSGGYIYFNETFYNLCINNDVPLIMWTIDTKEVYNYLYPSFFAILSNCLSAYDVIK